MEITVKIEAPELAKAIEDLAIVLGDRTSANAINVSAEPDTPKEGKPPAEDKAPENELVEEEPVKEESSIKLETVRKKLATLSQAGLQKEVKALIRSFGYKKLTEIPSEKYAELLEKAEELG
ncbi:hypothetical protein J9303_00340 [Bacillaceae bacterium Marseille-Q3522]|nr:hypothetical protein [Bacillaceae bacterium Marseille-Q3522]